MEGKKVALVVLLVTMAFTSSLARNQLVADGSNDRDESDGYDELIKMAEGAPEVAPEAAPPPRPSCFGNFCGGGLLPCDEPCYCFIPLGSQRGSCVDF